MKRHIVKAIIVLTLGLSVLTTKAQDKAAIDSIDQAEFPQITAQPVDRDVEMGGSTTLSVEATGESYQWLRNGVAIEGQTNSALTLKNMGTNDVGYYSCYVIKGTEVVPTRSANVTMSLLLSGGSTIVFGTPMQGSGSSGTCPGAYAGYVNYMKTVSQGWGWVPTVGETVHTATDENRSDTKVVYLGKYSDNGCAPTSVTVPHPTMSPKYRFTVFFPCNVPTNSYALTLTGFDP
jgi:hypothetical protein